MRHWRCGWAPVSVVQKTGPGHEAILRQGLGATEGRVEKLTLGGMAAHALRRPRRDARGRTGTLDATIVSGPRGQVFLLGRVARDGTAMDRARPALREAELSFADERCRPRGAPGTCEYRGAHPGPAGFAQLARSSPLTELPEQQLRLLNGVIWAVDADPGPASWRGGGTDLLTPAAAGPASADDGPQASVRLRTLAGIIHRRQRHVR